MTGQLSEVELLQLDDLLCNDALSDEAMLMGELDGFLAGLIVCPATIMPGEWMPVIWGGEEPRFESEAQAQTVVGLIMGLYNDNIHALDNGTYSPLYDFDAEQCPFWEIWIEGFWAAVCLRPQEWLAYRTSDDEDLQAAMFGLMRLYEMATLGSAVPLPGVSDEELEDLAPDLIPYAVGILHRARRAQAIPPTAPANSNHPKAGRNNPCPCGSGKKFKKCCLNG